MESRLRSALIAWLRADPALAGLNSVAEEAPLRASPPWLGIVASAATDWGAKGLRGREIRLALELHARGDDPAASTALAEAVERRIEAMPGAQAGFALIGALFLRSRAQQLPGNLRAILIEYRFRLLEAD